MKILIMCAVIVSAGMNVIMASDGRVFGSLADLAHVADVADASKGAALRASVASGTEDVGTVLDRVQNKIGDITDTPIPTAAASGGDTRAIEDRIDGVIALAWRMDIMDANTLGAIVVDARDAIAAAARANGSAGTLLAEWVAGGVGSGALALPAASLGAGLGLGDAGLGQTVYVAVVTEARRLAEAAITDLGYSDATDFATALTGANAANGGDDVLAWVAGAAAGDLATAIAAQTGTRDNNYCRAVAAAAFTFNRAYMNGTGADLWSILKAREEAFQQSASGTIKALVDGAETTLLTSAAIAAAAAALVPRVGSAAITGATNIHDLI